MMFKIGETRVVGESLIRCHLIIQEIFRNFVRSSFYSSFVRKGIAVSALNHDMLTKSLRYKST